MRCGILFHIFTLPLRAVRTLRIKMNSWWWRKYKSAQHSALKPDVKDWTQQCIHAAAGISLDLYLRDGFSFARRQKSSLSRCNIAFLAYLLALPSYWEVSCILSDDVPRFCTTVYTCRLRDCVDCLPRVHNSLWSIKMKDEWNYIMHIYDHRWKTRTWCRHITCRDESICIPHL